MVNFDGYWHKQTNIETSISNFKLDSFVQKQLFLLVRIHIFFLNQAINYKEEAPQAPLSKDITNKYT